MSFTIPREQADATVLVPYAGCKLTTTIHAPAGSLVQWRIPLEQRSTVFRRSVAWELRRKENSSLPLRAGSVHLADAVDNNMLSFTFDPVVCSEGTPLRAKRILSYRWHAAHQYEIYKLPHDFTLLTFDDLPGFTTKWGYEQRPLHPNVRLCAPDDIRVEDYDLAIVHFDENALAAYNTNGVIPAEWGAAFRWCFENISLPTIAVCHGVPQFYGQYGAPVPAGRQPGDIIEYELSRLVEYLRDVFVVANSHQAFEEWGFHQGQVVWHGFDPAEYQLSTYEKGVLTLGKNMAERPLCEPFMSPTFPTNPLSCHAGSTLCNSKMEVSEWIVP